MSLQPSGQSSLLCDAQVALLRRIAPPVPLPLSTRYDGLSKLEILLPGVRDLVDGKVVVDFGCGRGLETVELARYGAKVIAVDIDTEALGEAKRRALDAGVSAEFLTHAPPAVADAVISLDAFEHFEDPEQILRIMYDLLAPGGKAYISWGPPWYHPRGCHLHELPPWTHVFFSMKAILAWRRLMRGGNAQHWMDIGLNQMTIARFQRMVSESAFEVERLETVPIRPLRILHSQLTREWTTSITRAVLVKPLH